MKPEWQVIAEQNGWAPIGVLSRGGCISTYTGGRFYPLDPRSQEVNLLDIVHALAMICRYNGHIRFFYSVAQHSIEVYRELRRRGHSAKILLIGLLHDASEAYLSDLTTPVKRMLPEYKMVESAVQAAIWQAFGLTFTQEEYAIVKEVDTYILYQEAKALGVDIDGVKDVEESLDVCIMKEDMESVEKTLLHLIVKVAREYASERSMA